MRRRLAIAVLVAVAVFVTLRALGNGLENPETTLQPGDAPIQPPGSGERISINNVVEYTVRDAKGNIKLHGFVHDFTAGDSVGITEIIEYTVRDASGIIKQHGAVQ